MDASFTDEFRRRSNVPRRLQRRVVVRVLRAHDFRRADRRTDDAVRRRSTKANTVHRYSCAPDGARVCGTYYRYRQDDYRRSTTRGPAPAPAVATNGDGADSFHSARSFSPDIEQATRRSWRDARDRDRRVRCAAGRARPVRVRDTLVEQLGEALTAELGGARLARIANHRFAVAAVGERGAAATFSPNGCASRSEGALFEVDGKRCAARFRSGAAAIGESGMAGDAMNLAFRDAGRRARGRQDQLHFQWPSVTTLEAEGNTQRAFRSNRGAFSSSSTTRSRIRRSCCCSSRSSACAAIPTNTTRCSCASSTRRGAVCRPTSSSSSRSITALPARSIAG